MSDLMRGLPREGWAIRKPEGGRAPRYMVTEDRQLKAVCFTRRGAMRYIRRQKRAAERRAAKPRHDWRTDPPIFTDDERRP